MRRINVDRVQPAVKDFLRNLPVEQDGVELELGGRVICKVIPALQFSEAEKKALMKERWRLVRKAQERNKGVPARVIEREVREAVDEVRRRRKQ
jgi:hypothetical protein